MKPDNLNLSRIRSGLEFERANYALRLGVVQSRGIGNADFRALLGFGFKNQRLRFDYCLDFGKENEGISNLFSISFTR